MVHIPTEREHRPCLDGQHRAPSGRTQQGLATAGGDALMHLAAVVPMGLKTVRAMQYRRSSVSNVQRPSRSLTEKRNELPGSMCAWSQRLPTSMSATVATSVCGAPPRLVLGRPDVPTSVQVCWPRLRRTDKASLGVRPGQQLRFDPSLSGGGLAKLRVDSVPTRGRGETLAQRPRQFASALA